MWGLLMTMTAALLAVPSIRITDLLSTCVDSCALGCDEIRRVQGQRLGGDAFKVELKDPTDVRSALTEADGAAQRAIVTALRNEWGPDLRIVGEEDGDDVLDETVSVTTVSLRRNLLALDSDLTVDVSDITVYVDPLDGTREFVEGRIQNCQTLIGIAVKDQPIAGVMGLPFPHGDLTTPISIVYGLVGSGTGVYGEALRPVRYARKKSSGPRIATGDALAPVMVAARETVVQHFGGENLLYGGAGNKIFATARGEVDCTVQHKFGGPWDTCAPQAILTAMGGTITDMFGHPIQVYSDPKRNVFGYVATNTDALVPHIELMEALLSKPAFQEYRQHVASSWLEGCQ